jgi:hypothetical protein
MNGDHGIRRQRFDERSFEEGNHRAQWTPIRGRWKAFFVSLLLALAAHAEPPETGSWRVWLEPRFMHQPVTAPISLAVKTELAAGRLTGDFLEPLSKAELARLGATWESFAEAARANATADLAQLNPEYVRNRKKIIEYAELHSTKPIVASAALAPGFRALFEETLGPDILLVVPNQFTAYVFPKLASNYRDYAPMVQRAYRETSHPVSMEVFELTAAGMRAVGVYPDPARD